MSNAKDQIKKDIDKAQSKVVRASNDVADKTKKVAEKLKDKTEDLGNSIKKKVNQDHELIIATHKGYYPDTKQKITKALYPQGPVSDIDTLYRLGWHCLLRCMTINDLIQRQNLVTPD